VARSEPVSRPEVARLNHPDALGHGLHDRSLNLGVDTARIHAVVPMLVAIVVGVVFERRVAGCEVEKRDVAIGVHLVPPRGRGGRLVQQSRVVFAVSSVWPRYFGVISETMLSGRADMVGHFHDLFKKLAILNEVA